MRQKLLNTNIDYITIDQAVETVGSWLAQKNKHYIVTPNPEMVVDAGKDGDFLKALNSADLSIPDSSRLGWGSYVTSQRNPILRLISIPFFLFPHLLPRFNYPVTRGTDLMERLLSLSEEKAVTTAYLGGTPEVADKLFKCLRLKYPALKIVFSAGNVQVNSQGKIQFDSQNNKMTDSKDIKLNMKPIAEDLTRVNNVDEEILRQEIDIMFVAFGHKKQEKWMYENLPKLNTKVMIGVGGAFDYLSGSVPRAPKLVQELGFEWLFRLMVQPWRIGRFWKLFYFIYRVVRGK